MEINREKYITFKRSELYELFGELALPPWEFVDAVGRTEHLGSAIDCAPIALKIDERIRAIEVADAVVIRKSDKFAPDALEAYASTALTRAQVMRDIIGNAGGGIAPKFMQECTEIKAIADYFFGEANDARLKADHYPTP